MWTNYILQRLNEADVGVEGPFTSDHDEFMLEGIGGFKHVAALNKVNYELEFEVIVNPEKLDKASKLEDLASECVTLTNQDGKIFYAEIKEDKAKVKVNELKESFDYAADAEYDARTLIDKVIDVYIEKTK